MTQEYRAEVTWSVNGAPNIHGGIFSTMGEAVERIENWAEGKPSPLAKINGREVFLRNGRVVGPDHQPLCANPEWRELFAGEKIPPVIELPESVSAFVESMTGMLRGKASTGGGVL